MQEGCFGSIWKKFILTVFTFEGYFENYEKFVHFLEKAILGLPEL